MDKIKIILISFCMISLLGCDRIIYWTSYWEGYRNRKSREITDKERISMKGFREGYEQAEKDCKFIPKAKFIKHHKERLWDKDKAKIIENNPPDTAPNSSPY